jgi:hypothetical protein
MNPQDAAALLADADVDVVLEASLPDAKEILARCLEADVPVMLGKDDHCTKGCAPKLMILARPEDAARVHEVLRARWHEMASREGAAMPNLAAISADSMPCLACGAAVPDSAAECPDCGIAC